MGDKLATDESGELAEEAFDAVECVSCCVVAPYAVWQAEGDAFTPAQRASYAAWVAEQRAPP